MYIKEIINEPNIKFVMYIILLKKLDLYFWLIFSYILFYNIAILHIFWYNLYGD